MSKNLDTRTLNEIKCYTFDEFVLEKKSEEGRRLNEQYSSSMPSMRSSNMKDDMMDMDELYSIASKEIGRNPNKNSVAAFLKNLRMDHPECLNNHDDDECLQFWEDVISMYEKKFHDTLDVYEDDEEEMMEQYGRSTHPMRSNMNMKNMIGMEKIHLDPRNIESIYDLAEEKIQSGMSALEASAFLRSMRISTPFLQDSENQKVIDLWEDILELYSKTFHNAPRHTKEQVEKLSDEMMPMFESKNYSIYKKKLQRINEADTIEIPSKYKNLYKDLRDAKKSDKIKADFLFDIRKLFDGSDVVVNVQEMGTPELPVPYLYVYSIDNGLVFLPLASMDKFKGMKDGKETTLSTYTDITKADALLYVCTSATYQKFKNEGSIASLKTTIPPSIINFTQALSIINDGETTVAKYIETNGRSVAKESIVSRGRRLNEQEGTNNKFLSKSPTDKVGSLTGENLKEFVNLLGQLFCAGFENEKVVTKVTDTNDITKLRYYIENGTILYVASTIKEIENMKVNDILTNLEINIQNAKGTIIKTVISVLFDSNVSVNKKGPSFGSIPQGQAGSNQYRDFIEGGIKSIKTVDKFKNLIPKEYL